MSYAQLWSAEQECLGESRTTEYRHSWRRLTLAPAVSEYQEAIVDQRNVVILSSRGLFREGLKHLLAHKATVALAISPAEVEALLRREPIDLVILDQEDDSASNSDFVCQLLSTPGRRVITVSLDVNEIHIYQHHQVAHASPEALIAAVVVQ